jgi:hypothetical protein
MNLAILPLIQVATLPRLMMRTPERLTPAGETLSLTSAQLSLLIEGVDWRAPEQRWRPAIAG